MSGWGTVAETGVGIVLEVEGLVGFECTNDSIDMAAVPVLEPGPLVEGLFSSEEPTIQEAFLYCDEMRR